ncbi:MAG: glycosyltransferase family 2 protein [Planctomycetota bacterium]
MSEPKLSIVMPVRDKREEIVSRVERLLDSLVAITDEQVEIVVVDDGSRDGTVDTLGGLGEKLPQLRVLRHDRPRGMESAGQTGLERCSGELVFIQESDADVRIDDLRRLMEMAEDESVVAARAESHTTPVAPSLLRRLRMWGTDADRQIESRSAQPGTCSLQMVRRSHLQRLAGPDGRHYRMEAKTDRVLTVPKTARRSEMPRTSR